MKPHRPSRTAHLVALGRATADGGLSHDFVVYEDSGISDWNARFANGRAKVDRVAYMRIAIARI